MTQQDRKLRLSSGRAADTMEPSGAKQSQANSRLVALCRFVGGRHLSNLSEEI